MQSIDDVRNALLAEVANTDTPRDVLKSPEFKILYGKLGSLDPSERGAFGKAVNELKLTLEAAVEARETALEDETIGRAHV